MAVPTVPPAARTAGGRIDGLDGMRAVAALSVFCYHALWRAPVLKPLAPVFGHGDVGVEIFFVITGFLVSRPIASHLAGRGPRVGVGRFWIKRSLRIWPAYLVALAGAALIGLTSLRWPDGWLKNLFLVQSWFEDRGGDGLRVSWTLVVDVAFCAAVVPLGLVVGLARRHALTLWVAATVATVAFGSWALAWTTTNETHQAWRILPPYLPCFGLGMLLAVTEVAASAPDRLAPLAGRLLDGVRRMAGRWRWCVGAAVAVVGALMILLPANEVTPAVEFGRERQLQSFAQVAIAFLLLAPVLLRSGHPRLLDRRWSVAIGLASYGFFLWHIQVLRLVRPLLDDADLIAVVGLLLAVLGAFLVGEASRRWVEAPAGRLAKRLEGRLGRAEGAR